MRAKSRHGFSVVELAAVTAVVMLLVLALIPAIANKVMASDMTPVGVRGREIFVAITGANTEREPLGLPPVWPSALPPVTNNGPQDVECFAFSNSTDYFNYLHDGEYLAAESRGPYARGGYFSLFAGAGVPACNQGKLTAANNMWTVAMNVPDELDDTVPILITRNVDASSLAAKVTDTEWGRSLRFDPEWQTPFGDRAFLLIRKGGAIFRAREKYRSYGVVYGRQAFDATVGRDGAPVAHPLTYLTPTRAVVPGERAYAEGAVRTARLSGGIKRPVRRDLAALARVARPVGARVALGYLLAVGAYAAVRCRKRKKPCLTGYGLGVGLFHYAAVVLWLCLIMGSAVASGGAFCWTLLALALLAQAGGIAFAAARRRDDRAARQRGMKWMVAVPLLVPGGLLLLLVLGILANT